MLNLFFAYSIYLFFLVAVRIHFIKFTKKVFIFGAGSGLYENNVSVFCDYVRINVSNSDVYFVTDKFTNVPKVNRLSVLERGSVKAYFIAIIADVIVIDTSNFDVAPGAHRFLSGLKVNVNHGLEGLKRLPNDYYKNIVADINCSVSELELNIKIKECGIDPNKVFLTGLPRFDLINLNLPEKNQDVLLFLTWRSWLVNDNERINEYFDAISSYINKQVSEELGERTLYIKAHGQMTLEFKSDYPNIVILSEFDNLTEIIQKSAALITDYSSVAWDFIYNERPVFFYCYDYDEYKRKQGLYIDYKQTFADNFSENYNDAFNFLCNPQSSVIDPLLFFKHRDTNNCKRLVDLIDTYLL